MAAGTGYIQEFNSQPNDKIDVELFTSEYGLLNAAFDNNIGHNHNGTPGNGTLLQYLSDVKQKNTIEILGGTENEILITNDAGGTRVVTISVRSDEIRPGVQNTISLGDYQNRFKDLHLHGTGNLGALAVGFTNPTADPEEQLIVIDTIDNDPTLAANSGTALATQDSIKAYVDDSVTNSVGIFSRSLYNSRTSTQQATGALTPYITMVMSNISVGSKIHIQATISAEALAVGPTAGSIQCTVRRDGQLLLSKNAFVLSTTDTSNTVSGTVSMVFRDDAILSEHTYTLDFTEALIATGTGVATSATMMLLEEMA